MKVTYTGAHAIAEALRCSPHVVHALASGVPSPIVRDEAGKIIADAAALHRWINKPMLRGVPVRVALGWERAA